MATQITDYKCPACTGPLRFDGASGKLVCDYCGSSYEVAEMEALYAAKEKAAEETYNADAAKSLYSEYDHVFTHTTEVRTKIEKKSGGGGLGGTTIDSDGFSSKSGKY